MLPVAMVQPKPAGATLYPAPTVTVGVSKSPLMSPAPEARATVSRVMMTDAISYDLFFMVLLRLKLRLF